VSPLFLQVTTIYMNGRIRTTLPIINGLGGRWKCLPAVHHCDSPLEGSRVSDNRDYGTQIVMVDEACINIKFYNRASELIGSFSAKKSGFL
jgi:hypothetical protein